MLLNLCPIHSLQVLGAFLVNQFCKHILYAIIKVINKKIEVKQHEYGPSRPWRIHIQYNHFILTDNH